MPLVKNIEYLKNFFYFCAHLNLIKNMKKLFYLIVLIAALICVNETQAQSRKEKKQAKKNKAQSEQQTPARGKETSSPEKPATAVTPSTTDQPGGRTPSTTVTTPSVTETSKPEKQPQVINVSEIVASTRPVVTERPNGSVNWTEQYIEAKGASVIDNVKFTNPAQAKAMATRGAQVVAQRNLLEIINGVNVTSETTVKDMIAQNDFIYTRVDGVIKGAEMVGEAIEKDGMIEVKMRVPIYQRNGLAPALYNNIENKNLSISPELQQQLSKELQEQVLNGIAFNFKGKTFDPSMFPIVVDEKGNLVFDFSKVYDPNTGEFPKIVSATETFFKDLGFDKGVQYLDILRTEPGKIVLDNKNIKKVNWQKIGKTAASIGKFLMMFI